MRKHYWLKKWRRKLNINREIKIVYVPRQQVCCELKIPYRLVGICKNTIYHDRRLTEEDIIHELLHVKYPRYKESTIRKLTNEIKESKSRQKACVW